MNCITFTKKILHYPLFSIYQETTWCSKAYLAKNKVHNPLSLSLGPQSKAHKNIDNTDRGAHTQHPIHPVLMQKEKERKKNKKKKKNNLFRAKRQGGRIEVDIAITLSD